MTRVRLTVTLDVDEEAWARTYGVDASRLRDDVRHHVAGELHDRYVDALGLAREVVVRRESSHRVASLFS